MLTLYYYNKVEIASVFHIHVCRMLKIYRSIHHHPRRGRACPARALSAAARYCFTHPVSPHTVGRGLDPSAARRGRRPLQRWPETTPHPRTFRPAPAHPSTTPVGAGHARPATFPSPAVNLPPPTPHNLCPPPPITPIYTLPKLLPQTLSKKSKKLAKTC